MNPHFAQLEKFYYIQKELLKNGNKYGLEVSSPIDHSLLLRKNQDDEIDLYLSAIIHGNEVIGLYLINEILEQIIAKKIHLKINLLVTLGNVSAFLLNKRFIIKDMNRLFNIAQKNKHELKIPEEHRAWEIEKMILNFPKLPSAILDIHQTTAASETPFLMAREHASTLKWCQDINIKEQWPLIYYPRGNMFSIEGASLSTFCVEHNIPEITIELGQVGFHTEIFSSLLKITLEMLDRPQSYWRKEINNSSNQKIEDYLSQAKSKILREAELITKKSDTHELIAGWKNLTFIPKGTHYATDLGQTFYTTDDSYILFPKYGEYQKTSLELCRFLKQIPTT